MDAFPRCPSSAEPTTTDSEGPAAGVPPRTPGDAGQNRPTRLDRQQQQQRHRQQLQPQPKQRGDQERRSPENRVRRRLTEGSVVEDVTTLLGRSRLEDGCGGDWPSNSSVGWAGQDLVSARKHAGRLSPQQQQQQQQRRHRQQESVDLGLPYLAPGVGDKQHQVVPMGNSHRGRGASSKGKSRAGRSGGGGGGRRGDAKKGKAYRKLWEQVTKVGEGERLEGNGKLGVGEMSVEDIVRVVQGLPIDKPAPPVVSHALYHLDSRAVAALLKELARVGRLQRAFELFDWLRALEGGHELGRLCDVYTYTTMISLCGHDKHLRRALELVAELRSRGIQCNVHTYSAMMNVCIKCGELDLALDVYKKMKAEGLKPNVVTYNTLIDVYGKIGQWKNAVEVLEQIKAEGLEPEIRTYNTALIACNMCGQPLEALKVYDSLLEAGFTPMSTTYTALISAYGKAGKLDKALDAYKEMITKNFDRTAITYAALIGACEKAGRWELALQLFHTMIKEGCQPNTVVYNSLIAVCCQAGEWQKANEVYERMKLHGCKPDMNTYTMLLAAYDRAGEWQQIAKLFDSALQAGGRPDVQLYHTVIDTLWATGIVWAQIKAVQIFNSALRNCRARLGVQQNVDKGLMEVVVQPMSVGVAVLSVHKWLIEARTQVEKDPSNYVDVDEVVLCLGRGRSVRDPVVKMIKASLSGMLAGIGAPFSSAEDDPSSPRLSCRGRQLRDWLQLPTTLVALNCIVADPSKCTTSFRGQGFEERNSSLKRRCREAFEFVCSFERSHRLNFEAMGEEYICTRSNYISLLLNLGQHLHLKPETVHDAVLLLDRVMSTGARLQEGVSSVAVAALLHVCAEQSEALQDVPQTEQLDMLVNFPIGSVDKLKSQIFATVDQDIAAISALRVVNLYLEWLGHNDMVQPSAQSKLYSLMELALYSPSFLNFRPSVTAAAILYLYRVKQGLVPFWPSGLTNLTGIEDLNVPEFAGAVQAANNLEMSTNATSPTSACMDLGP